MIIRVAKPTAAYSTTFSIVHKTLFHDSFTCSIFGFVVDVVAPDRVDNRRTVVNIQAKMRWCFFILACCIGVIGVLGKSAVIEVVEFL